MSDTNEFRHILKEVVDEIRKDSGEEFLLDGQIVVAYLADMGPEFVRERKTLRYLYQDGWIDQIFYNVQKTTNIQMVVGKYSSIVEEEYSMKSSAAQEYVSAIVYALTGQYVGLKIEGGGSAPIKTPPKLNDSSQSVTKLDPNPPAKKVPNQVQAKVSSPKPQKSTNATPANKRASAQELFDKGLIAYKAKDYRTMYKNMKEASDMGHMNAAYYLAYMYEMGLHVVADEAKAIVLYDAANKKGHQDAGVRADKLRQKVKQPKTGAVQRKVAINTPPKQNVEAKANTPKVEIKSTPGAAVAKQKSGAEDAYQKGLAAYKANDLRTMYKCMKEASDMGHMSATYYLGYMYENGLHVMKDEAKAMGLYDTAYKKGHKEAGARVDALRNKLKKGTETKTTNSKPTVNPAANQAKTNQNKGNNNAQTSADEMYQMAFSAYQAKNYETAAPLMKEAALAGKVAAMMYMGFFYERGYGVKKNAVEAMSWYRKAANRGNAFSQGCLGYFYLRGLGVTVNKTEAVKWFKKGAENGDKYSQGQLGYLYEIGDGVPKDKAEAIRWYKTAAEKGDEFAKKRLQAID